MAYKPSQLPFKEFSEIARELKQREDKSAPHYPLAILATDANGQHLVQQVFMGPNARAAVQVLADEDWDLPVVMTMTDGSGLWQARELETVTPRVEETSVQAIIPGFELAAAAYDDATRKARKQWKAEIEAKLDEQRKADSKICT